MKPTLTFCRDCGKSHEAGQCSARKRAVMPAPVPVIPKPSGIAPTAPARLTSGSAEELLAHKRAMKAASQQRWRAADKARKKSLRN